MFWREGCTCEVGLDPARAICPLCEEISHSRELQEMLDFLLGLLNERSDVRDGAEGKQLPNEAMSILAEYETRFP